MTEPIALKYRAFISYSHIDTSWAKWLHGKLEGFPIDKDLVGREIGTGTIPKTLRPIFRDRDDFTAGDTLSEQTLEALDASQALIVICSPASAKSYYVNEELRLFKSRHPDLQVIPLIVGGTPDDPKDECFAPALKFKVTPQGEISDLSDEPLAADVREKGDGKNLALAKVVAGLLGVSSDDVFRRAERERRRQSRIRSTIGLVIAGLVAVGGFLAWQSYQQRQTIAEVEALVAKYSLASPAEGTAPDAKASLTQAITAIAEGAAGDARYAKALELLKEGKPSEADPLLEAIAKEKKARIGHDSKQAALAYKNLGAIRRLSDPKTARDAYAEAAALDPDDIEIAFWNGRLQYLAGDTTAAEQAYMRAITIGQNEALAGERQYAYLWSKLGLGETAERRGDLNSALNFFRELLFEADRFVKSDPANPDGQFSLAAAHEGVGKILGEQGDFDGALKSYRAAFAITDRFASGKPDDVVAQRSRAMTLKDIGEILVAQGSLAEALKTFRESAAIMNQIIAAHPENIHEHLFLWVSLDWVGKVLQTQGDLPEALKTFRDAHTIAERMAEADPWNDHSLGRLMYSLIAVGSVLKEQSNLPEALKIFQKSLAAANRRAKSDPTKTEWQRELAFSYSLVGEVLQKQGDFATALDNFRESSNIFQRLGGADPTNTKWQAALEASYTKIGDVLVTMGNLDDALKSFQDSLAVAHRLATADPSNPEYQSDIAFINDKIGDAQLEDGKRAEGLTSYQKSLAIRRQLAETDKDNPRWQADEAASLSNIGNVNFNSGDNVGALLAYEELLTIMRRLVKTDENNHDWQRSLAISLRGIGNAKFGSSDSAGALAAYQESAVIYRHLSEANARDIQSQTELTAGLYNIAVVATGTEKEAVIQEAVKILDHLNAAGKLPDEQKNWKIELLAMRDPSKHGWLGVAIESVPEALVPSLQLGDVKGALIANVQPDSPAERGGFRVGDVIASFNDTTVQDASGFMNLLAETDIGQTATITVLRDGKPQLLQVTLGELKEPSSPEGEIPSIDAPTESETLDQTAGAKPSGSPTEDLDPHLFDEYFKDLVASQR